MTAGTILGAALLAAALVACGGDDADVSSIVPSSAPADTVSSAPADTVSSAPADTVSSTLGSSSVVPTSTAPATSTTSTTVAPTAVLVLRPDGLGDALFGTDPDAVIGYVVAILGPPTTDSGWVSAAGPFGVCPGNEVREVSWGDLRLLFGDTSQVTVGRRHFFHYEHGPAGGTGIEPAGIEPAEIEPAGMVTASAVGVGATLTDLFAAHPDTEVVPADEIGGPYFVLADGLFGQLSGAESAAVVQSIAGGVGCGE